LEVPTVQFGITFDKRVEIHLEYRKHKIGSKNFETSTQQYVCSLFYVQRCLEYERHFIKVVSQGAFSIYMIGKQTYAKEPRNINWYPNKCC
jgi:hypothetical protein